MDVPSRRSLDTTASGLNAESIISLSAFPGTPVSTDFNPSVFRRQLPSLPTSRSSQRGSPQPSNSDWHDGASSISRGRVDSTIPGVTASFIQNAMSDEQDARSEITYPPLSPPQTQYAPSSRSSRRPPPLRLPSDGGDPPAMKTGGSTPNTAPRSALTASEEDASIAAAHHGSIHRDIRTNSVTKSLGLQGAEVVGVAPATIVQTLSRRSSQPLSHRQSGYLSKLPSHREEPPDDIPDDISRHSESGRSYVPSFISSSAHSLRRVLNRYSRYGRTPSPAPPLPPNPNIPASYKSYETYFFQNGSTSNLPFLGKRDPTSPAVAQSTANSLHVWPPAARNSGFSPLDGHPLDSPKVRESSTRGRKKKIIILSVVILALVVTGIVVGVVVSLKNKVASAASSCANGLAGADCSMNATCVCTSSSSRCDGLSQNLVDLIPTVNQLFQTNYSQSEVYSAVWASVGSSKNCISQANVVDLAPALTKAKSPNRLEFAQSAILWNLVESQDLTSAQKLRSFIVNAPWATLTSSDGTQDGTNGSFGTTISGFNFDFASQKVSPPSISFVSSASPSSEQLSRIAPGARDVLDRMYSVARASATQHKVALNTYWTGTLQQNSDDLKTFLSAFLNSPILLPFDSQSDDMLNLMQHNQSSSFPPPLACSPSLNSTKLDRVNHLESTVFALPNVTTAKSYSADCYPSRPTYGRLDVLQLRLPFSDQEGGDKLPKQALALKRDAGSRVVVYPWNINSALLASDPGSALSSTQTDYRQYGTLNSAEHVVLAYLQSIGDVNLAMSFIKFLLQDTRAPPPTDFALDRMPIIEVAIFGTLDRSDFTSATTAFSTKSGGVFFGSSDSGTLRDWANSANLPIFWAEKAGSTQVVRQTSSPPQAFSDAWKASSDSLKNDIDVTVKQITDSLSSTGQFTAAYGFG